MTQTQWDKHQEHLDSHISWPATKEEIVAACGGQDVDAEVLEDIKMEMPDGDRKYSKQEMHDLMVVMG
jgi:hypothetical protein